LVTPDREEQLNLQTLRYINGLSDLLFILARVLTKRAGGSTGRRFDQDVLFAVLG